jgi:hypothetical protein
MSNKTWGRKWMHEAGGRGEPELISGGVDLFITLEH